MKDNVHGTSCSIFLSFQHKSKHPLALASTERRLIQGEALQQRDMDLSDP